jgi:hypothetical protein
LHGECALEQIDTPEWEVPSGGGQSLAVQAGIRLDGNSQAALAREPAG